MKLYTILRNLIQSIKNALQEAKDYTDARGDYIVEQGTSGIWFYRKWASGIAECWGSEDRTQNVNRTWYNIFITQTTVTPPSYPFTFTKIDLAEVILSSSNSWVMFNTDSTTTSPPLFFIASANSVTSRPMKINYHTKGLWKTLENVGGVILNLLNIRRVVFA